MNHLVTIIETWGPWGGVITGYLVLRWVLRRAGVSTCGSCTTRPVAGQATDDYADDEVEDVALQDREVNGDGGTDVILQSVAADELDGRLSERKRGKR